MGCDSALSSYFPPAVALGTEETKGDGDTEPDGEPQEDGKGAAYEYSLDPDTRAAEKKLRRVVAKQVAVLVGVGVGQTRRACMPLSCLMRFLCT